MCCARSCFVCLLTYTQLCSPGGGPSRTVLVRVSCVCRATLSGGVAPAEGGNRWGERGPDHGAQRQTASFQSAAEPARRAVTTYIYTTYTFCSTDSVFLNTHSHTANIYTVCGCFSLLTYCGFFWILLLLIAYSPSAIFFFYF